MYLKEYLEEEENLEIFYSTTDVYKIELNVVVNKAVIDIKYEAVSKNSIKDCLEKIGNKIVKVNESINNIKISKEFIFEIYLKIL